MVPGYKGSESMPDEEPVEEPSPTLVRMLVDALGEAPGEASVTGQVVEDDAALCTAPVVAPVEQVADDDRRC